MKVHYGAYSGKTACGLEIDENSAKTLGLTLSDASVTCGRCIRSRANNVMVEDHRREAALARRLKLPTEEEAYTPVKAERSYLTDLTKTVTAFLAALDKIMHTPDTVDRGRRVARITNELEFANDRARHFGLGEPLTKKATARS